jgi:N-acetylglucosaminyl-diphospho-decaprenol L-rhamnosyltransferase
VGIVGSRLEDPDGTPQQSAFRFPGILSEFEAAMRLGLLSKFLARFVVAPPLRLEDHSTDWVAGASMLVRRELFETVGLLDESFFLYFEETDLCLRARRVGWVCWYIPDSRVVHFVGQSTGGTGHENAARRLPKYWFESRRHFFLKNYGWLRTFLADLAWTLGYAIYRVRVTVQRKTTREPPHLFGDFVRFNFFRGVARW